MAFKKILVANRGEIAVRIMATAQALGYETVALFTVADQRAAHVEKADLAVCIGEGPVSDSYLNQERIMAAAKQVGADAVHPGYGFLSENASFAQACKDNDLVFIGPAASTIELMANKRLAKRALEQAGVRCIPGYSGDNQDPTVLETEARNLGFPLMIKAAAGGGGRGMRLLETAHNIQEQLQAARSESESAFGCGELILEKALIKARHIEIQIFADGFGNTVYLGERDCSIQRRHQKVVEESPSPAVDEPLRRLMGEAAVAVAKACNYCGAGTVEFLLDDAQNFYFLEMNTRLQVEHPVTEMVTGYDLVAWQFMVAAGEPLPVGQEQISITGHAIEVRLYGEDPGAGFLPQTGEVLQWRPGEGEGIRVDSGIQVGQTVSAYYDPMLAKLIAVGCNREQARRRLLRSVQRTVLFGVTHNSDFLAALLDHPQFVSGDVTTNFITQNFNDHCSLKSTAPDPPTLALACLLFHLGETSKSYAGHHALDGSWYSSGPLHSHLVLNSGGDDVTARVTVATQSSEGFQKAKAFNIAIGETSLAISVLEYNDSEIVVVLGSVRDAVFYCLQSDVLYFKFGSRNWVFNNKTRLSYRPVSDAVNGSILAPMDGAVVELNVKPGDQVEKGQTLMVLEAMKMEHPLKAPLGGVVEKINVSQGAQVKGRQLLLQLALDC